MDALFMYLRQNSHRKSLVSLPGRNTHVNCYSVRDQKDVKTGMSYYTAKQMYFISYKKQVQ